MAHRQTGKPAGAANCARPAYFGDSVTGTSVTVSTGSLLRSAALRIAASLGASYTQNVLVSSALA